MPKPSHNLSGRRGPTGGQSTSSYGFREVGETASNNGSHQQQLDFGFPYPLAHEAAAQAAGTSHRRGKQQHKATTRARRPQGVSPADALVSFEESLRAFMYHCAPVRDARGCAGVACGLGSTGS